MMSSDYASFASHPVLVMPEPAGHIALTVVAAVVLGLGAWGLVRARANGGVLLLALGAALASSSMEAWAEYMAMNYHPEVGGHIAYTAWGMPVPVHIALSYALYFGGPGYGLLQLIQRGRTAGFWWKLFGVFCVAVAGADLAALNSGVWMYYGPQPFVVWQFPVTWMFCNVAAMFGFAVIVHACLLRWTGLARLWTLLVAPVGLSMVWAGVCLPLANALHGAAGPWLIRAGACASIAASVFLTSLAIRYFCWAAGRRIIPAAGVDAVPSAAVAP